MFWNSKNILVTGAGGFIGSHLVEELVRQGARVTAFLRYKSDGNPGHLADIDAEIAKSVQIQRGDLKDPAAIRQAVEGHQIVFHLGALIGIPYSYVRPIDYVETNILGSSYIFESCRQVGVERIVHTSTSEVYGTARVTPIDEGHPLQGQSPYSATKIAADQLALSYFCSFNLPVTIVRPFNTFGPRQSLRAIIPTVISQALQNDVIRVGSVWPKRDLTFVTDTVRGFLKAAESQTAIGEVVNIGSGREISIGELIDMILRLVGRKLEIVTDEDRIRPEKSEVGRLLANREKAKRLLDWQPDISLEDGLQRTIDWVRAHLNRYRDTSYRV
jgi:NAD dependent epimerase/dehydratase